MELSLLLVVTQHGTTKQHHTTNEFNRNDMTWNYLRTQHFI
jgi:hypothetical protein